MPDASTEQAPQKTLSRGFAIAYKAYKRKFLSGTDAAAIVLVATCYYKSNGFTIYFEENAGQWNFMEIAPTGIVHYIDTYYVASWTNGLELQVPPAEVTITDGHGQHIVPVESW
jgi:hypothetical protein